MKNGFIVASESGTFRVFVKSDNDPKKMYQRVEGDDLFPDPQHYTKDSINQQVYQDIDIHKINAVALSPSEDMIVFTTKSNQIIKVSINLDRPNEE